MIDISVVGCGKWADIIINEIFKNKKYNLKSIVCRREKILLDNIKTFSSIEDMIEDNSLDFVFLDADHGFDGCSQDIEKWTPKVKSGGFITGHDIWLSGVQKAVQKHFGNDYKKHPDHVWIHRKK